MRGELGGDVDDRVPVVRELVGLLQGQGRLALAGCGADGIIQSGVNATENVVEGLEAKVGDGLVALKGA